jgi:hypothetical protein
MAVKPTRSRAPAPHQVRPLSAPATKKRGGKKQWDDTTAPPPPAREPRSLLDQLPTPRGSRSARKVASVVAAVERASAAPKARTSSVTREYELAQKASARLEEEIARQAKLDTMLNQVRELAGPSYSQATYGEAQQWTAMPRFRSQRAVGWD